MNDYQNLTSDELIAQVMDDAILDHDKFLRGELARRLMVAEQCANAANRELWEEGYTSSYAPVAFLEVIRKMSDGSPAKQGPEQ